MPRRSHDAINDLRDAALACGFDRDALLYGMNFALVAQLRRFKAPSEQFHADLHTLNGTPRLEDGSDPLMEWLVSAAALAHPRQEAAVFSRYRNKLLACETGPRECVREERSAQPDSAAAEAPYIPEFPTRHLEIYPRLWQLETWLRRMVYVELRALLGDSWTSKIRGADEAKSADKKLTHMSTPETDPLSYVPLEELCRIVEEDWNLFEHFLPQKLLWQAKIHEVAHVRHRVLHFRQCHQNDLQRVTQLLRDLDPGVMRFCTSYNTAIPLFPQSEDPVVDHFVELDPFPWTLVGEKQIARLGTADPDALFGMTIEVIRRPWYTGSKKPAAGNQGLLYDITISGRRGRRFDYERLLGSTEDVHKHFAHIVLDSAGTSVRLTLPTILGAQQCIDILTKFTRAVSYAVEPGPYRRLTSEEVQALADAWPEYVLGPDNLLPRLTSEIADSAFGA